MLFLLLSCFSFLLLSKSLSPKHHPPSKMSLISLPLPWFWRDLSLFDKSTEKPIVAGSAVGEMEGFEEVSLLDLPELALECVLEKLPPSGLLTMGGVCSSLRERCRSDHFWERHLRERWGNLIGDAAYREWLWHIASRNRPTPQNPSEGKGFFGDLSNAWPLSWISPKLDHSHELRGSSSVVDSVRAFYFALESGEFWFPAQVYNRENGHVGFMLSCYDAKLCYDSRTDTFRASYTPPYGRQIIEENIDWTRLRAPAVDTPPHVLHVSDCLTDLQPGNHIEIQWRSNKEFPYGWWYGVVGHLESCNQEKSRCRCHSSDSIILEFKQYTPGSRWRQTVISRKDHREVGNDTDGFYGGIRKLYDEKEISMWKRLWPIHVLE